MFIFSRVSIFSNYKMNRGLLLHIWPLGVLRGGHACLGATCYIPTSWSNVHGEKPRASPAHTLSCYKYMWSPVGPERREGWVLMQRKSPVSGERPTCTESTWEQSDVLSLREVSHGQGPRSVCYNNSEKNTSGSMCSSATITRHCYGTGDTSWNKTDEIPA